MDRKLSFLHTDTPTINKSVLEVDIFKAISQQPQRSSVEVSKNIAVNTMKDTSSVSLINRIDDIIDKISTQVNKSSPPPTKNKQQQQQQPVYSELSMIRNKSRQNNMNNIPQRENKNNRDHMITVDNIIHNSNISPEVSANLFMKEIENDSLTQKQPALSRPERKEKLNLPPVIHESRLESLKNELDELKVLQIETKRKLKNSLTDKLSVDPSYINKQIEKEVKAIEEAIHIEEDLLQGKISEEELVHSHLNSLGKLPLNTSNSFSMSHINEVPPKSQLEEKLQQTIQDMKEKLVVDLLVKSNSTGNLQNQTIPLDHTKQLFPKEESTTYISAPQSTPPPALNIETSKNSENETLEISADTETKVTTKVPIIETEEADEESMIRTEQPIILPLSRTNSSYSIISEASETSSVNTNITHEVDDRDILDVPSIRLRQLRNEEEDEDEDDDYEKASVNSVNISTKASSENPFFITRSRSNSNSSANSFKITSKGGITDSEEDNVYTGTDTEEQPKENSPAIQNSFLTVNNLASQQGRTSRSNSTSSTGEEYQLPPDMYMPTVPSMDLPKLKNYFLTGGASFSILLHKKDKGKEKHIKALLEFPDREVTLQYTIF